MDEGVWIIIVIAALLVGWLGSTRKIGFGWAFALSFLTSPLIALIITLCSKKKEVEFIEEK
ncbi:MAG: hypothetical protein IJF01_03700 [Tidjanibacter sp.]|nr:hypothetical protein [Tidjanibacter sp.]